MFDIICVTNRKLCQEDFLTRIEKLAASHPCGIILRENDLSPAEYRALAQKVMAICDRRNVKCILHSFVDIALELDSKSIHLPLALLRNMPQEKKAHFTSIGASCHSTEDAYEAQLLGCTYITAGHIFDTDCKKGLPGRGISFLKEVCSAVTIPVYAIGGISRDKIAEVRSAGAGGICLMSSLMVCEDIPELLRTLEEKK